MFSLMLLKFLSLFAEYCSSTFSSLKLPHGIFRRALSSPHLCFINYLLDVGPSVSIVHSLLFLDLVYRAIANIKDDFSESFKKLYLSITYICFKTTTCLIQDFVSREWKQLYESNSKRRISLIMVMTTVMYILHDLILLIP